MPSSARDHIRIMRIGRHLLSLSFTLLLSNACADEAFDLGIDAFNRGSYAEAVSHFLAAQADNPDDPDLQYNLGASYYKLGRYQEARQAFLQAAEYPDMAPLAYYNLALVAARLNQPDQVRS